MTKKRLCQRQGDSDAAVVSRAASGPCALTDAEVSGVIKQEVTETFTEGNWGIASTCTYATAAAPAAIRLSSAMSSDLSSDRMFDGVQEVPALGDEAVWVPVLSNLTVIDRSKNKLLRIGVGVPGTKPERLEIAKAIARLALPKL